MNRAKFRRRSTVGSAGTSTAVDARPSAEALDSGDLDAFQWPLVGPAESDDGVSADGYWEWSEDRQEWVPTAAFLDRFGATAFSPDGYWEWSEARQEWLPTRALLDELSEVGPVLLSPDGKWAWSDRRQEWLSTQSLREVLNDLEGSWDWDEADEERDDVDEVAPISPRASAEVPRRAMTDRRARVVAAALVVVLVIAFLVTVVLPGGGSTNGAAINVSNGTLTWPARSYPNGVTIDERWSLRGADNTDFDAVITLTNPTGKPLSVQHDAVIPKSLAATASSIRFNPRPVTIEEDPVVRWNAQLEALGTVRLEYLVDVESSTDAAKTLQGWYEDAQKAIADYQRRSGAPVPKQVEPEAQPEIEKEEATAPRNANQASNTTRAGTSGSGDGPFLPPISLPNTGGDTPITSPPVTSDTTPPTTIDTTPPTTIDTTPPTTIDTTPPTTIDTTPPTTIDTTPPTTADTTPPPPP